MFNNVKLQVENIQKSFAEKKVLKGANLEIEQGKIYGLIGRNGAGKTTLFNILYGDLAADAGKMYISIDGNKRELRPEDVGLLFSQPFVPDFMTGFECIKFYLDVHNLPSSPQDVHAALDIVALEADDRHRLVRDYSHGMKNKIMMLMVFMAKPPVILLDEPLTSLDIVLAAQIKDFFRSYKRDHIIIMSTHILDLAKSLCDDIILLRDGYLENLSEEEFRDPNFEENLVKLLTQNSEHEHTAMNDTNSGSDRGDNNV